MNSQKLNIYIEKTTSLLNKKFNNRYKYFQKINENTIRAVPNSILQTDIDDVELFLEKHKFLFTTFFYDSTEEEVPYYDKRLSDYIICHDIIIIDKEDSMKILMEDL